MASEVFRMQIDLKTVIIHMNGDQIKIEEHKGYQLSQSSLKSLKDNQIPLLEVNIKGRGTIIIDLFYRNHKLHKNQTQTLTEQGSRKLSG